MSCHIIIFMLSLPHLVITPGMAGLEVFLGSRFWNFTNGTCPKIVVIRCGFAPYRNPLCSNFHTWTDPCLRKQHRLLCQCFLLVLALLWLLFTKFGGLCVTNTPLLFIFLTKQGNGLRARHLVLPTMSVELEWMTKHWCLQIYCECLCAAREREGHSFQFSFAMLTIWVLVKHLIPTCGSPVVATLHCKARGHEIVSRPRRPHFDADEVQKRPSTMHCVHAKEPEVVRYNWVPHYGMPHI